MNVKNVDFIFNVEIKEFVGDDNLKGVKIFVEGKE